MITVFFTMKSGIIDSLSLSLSEGQCGHKILVLYVMWEIPDNEVKVGLAKCLPKINVPQGPTDK